MLECRIEPTLSWNLPPSRQQQQQQNPSRWKHRRENRIRDPWAWLTGTRRKPKNTSLESGIELDKKVEIIPLKTFESSLSRSNYVSEDSRNAIRKRIKKKKKVRAENCQQLTSSDEEEFCDVTVKSSRHTDICDVIKQRHIVGPSFSGDAKLSHAATSPIEALWICSASLISTEGGRGEARPEGEPPQDVRSPEDPPDLDKDLDQEVEKYLREVDKRLSGCPLPDNFKVTLVLIKERLLKVQRS